MNVMGHSFLIAATKTRPSVTSISVHLHIENTPRSSFAGSENPTRHTRAGLRASHPSRLRLMRVMRHHRDGPAARGISLRATVEMPTKGLHGRDVLLRHRGEALFPLQRCRNIRGQLFTFLRCADVIAALELRVQFFGEQLETLANVLMLVVAAL